MRARQLAPLIAILLLAVLLLRLVFVTERPSEPAASAAERAAPCPQVDRSPSLVAGCSDIYLDVGSNIGVQVRKLFEPAKYFNSSQIEVYNSLFGLNRSRVCAFGFEASPKHVERLQSVESCYNSLGWRVKFFVPFAVTTQRGNVTFYNDRYPQLKHLSSSLTKIRGGKEFTVPTFDLARFVLDVVAKREGKGKVYMKMDIEGAEYDVLTDLMVTGAMQHIDLITIEWHQSAKRHLGNAVQDLLSHSATKVAKLVDLDDESYFSDGMAMPCP
jgi:FkbM family methyltransferase